MRLTCILLIAPYLSAGAFNVRDYGAAGDGLKKDTSAFAKAVAAASKAGGGTVLVPPGKYLTGAIELQSHLTLEVESGATLLASPDVADYPLHDSAWGTGRKEISSLIFAEKAEDVTIRGRGTIDGQGQHWWRRMGPTGRRCRAISARQPSWRNSRCSPTDGPR